MIGSDSDLIEIIAEIEHEQWMSWAESIMTEENLSDERKARWEQFLVPYDELPEDIKEHDRVWARKVLDAICM